jgi:hypothetical protein
MPHEDESVVEHEELEVNDAEQEMVSDDEAGEPIHVEWAGFI